MPSQPSRPDAAAIEAWLAGRLSEDEAAAVERQVETMQDIPVESGFEPGLLQDVGEIRRTAEAIAPLVEEIKTRGGSAVSAPSADEWREVLTPSENPELLGMLGSYEVLEVIATGGMGIVFKARDPELDRFAALKALAPGLATNATARERFLREARAAAALEHENILPIYGIHSEPVPWFAMRYVAGGSLQQALDRGEKFDLARLRSLARQVARALDAAHEAGIVHRDIKPANILCDDSSLTVWVCDFGIARATDDPGLTYGGTMAGTPNYMSPEQAEGKPLDGRSDLFSLGAVLYRCATGEPAFPGETTTAVLRRIVGEEPKPSAACTPKLPKWFHRLLLNLLAKDPRDRFRTAKAVIRAIDDERSPRPRHTVRRRKRQAIALLTLTVLAGAVFGLLQVPAIALAANRLVAEKTDRVIINTSRLGAHASLAAAIAAAHPGDTIEFTSAGPFRIDRTEVPAGKPLTLRAAAGVVPQLEVREAAQSGITIHSDVRFERLKFVILGPRDRGRGIVRVGDCRAEIDHCLFAAIYQMDNPWNRSVQAVIEMLDHGDLDIRDTLFRIGNAKAVVIAGPDPNNEGTTASVRVRNSYLEGLFAISFDHGVAREVTVDLEDCLVVGRVFLWNPNGVRAPDTANVHLRNTVFSASRTVVWLGNSDPESARAMLHWRGENNLYREDRGLMIYTTYQGEKEKSLARSLASATQSLDFQETGSAEMVFQHVFMERVAREVTAEAVARFLRQFPETVPRRGPDAKKLGPGGE